MHRHLLLLLAVLCAGCASTPKGDHHTDPQARQKTKKKVPEDAIAYSGPTPAVRPPPTIHTPAGAGAPAVGQPGYQSQQVPRSNDPRILPPTREPTVFAASRGDGRKPVVRGLKPRSATDKDAWEECEKFVADAVTDTSQMARELVEALGRLSAKNGACLREQSMRACYIHLTAKTKDPVGLFRSSAEKEDFREEMSRRVAQACTEKDKDTEMLAEAIIGFRRLHDWKTPTDSRNLNRAFLTPEARAQHEAWDNLVAEQRRQVRMQKEATVRARTITTGRTKAKPQDMTGQYMPIPQKAYEDCWGATQSCLDDMGDDVQRLGDPIYECLRWAAVRKCVVEAYMAGTNADSSYASKNKKAQQQQAHMRQRYGMDWEKDAGWKILDFGRPFREQVCPERKHWDKTWDAYFDRIDTQCPKHFSKVLGLP